MSQDTSSKAERKFHKEIEMRTGLVFVKVRPHWLKNPATAQSMELDMYNEDVQIAIEYNGIQHYHFPNSFHKSYDEFLAQQQRDCDKVKICDEYGVALISVKASNLDDEVDYALGELNKLGIEISQYRRNSVVESLVSLLSFSRADSYAPWIQLGWCLHNISTELLPLWVAFSKHSEEKFVPGECQELWKEMRCNGLGIGSLHMWARSDSPYDYKMFLNQRVDIKNCNGTHSGIAKVAAEILKGQYVCATSSGKNWYYFDGTLWRPDNDGIRVRHALTTTVVEQFFVTVNAIAERVSLDDMQSQASMSSASDAQKSVTERLLKIVMKLQDRVFKDNIVMEMRPFLYDEHFLKKLDADRNLIAFSNGVWCLREGLMRSATPDDYLSLSTGYEFEEIHKIDPRIEKYWTTLHPNPDQRAYVKKTFARQLYGDCGQELFHIHSGYMASAANGKTKFFEILELVLGGYVRKIGIELLTSKDRIEPGKPMPEFAHWKGTRFLYCTEPNHDEKLHTGILKDLTGGETIQYRNLFSNEVQSFRPCFKLHLMCNDVPYVDGSDSGVKRRIRKIDYISRFVDAQEVNTGEHKYPRDSSLIDAFKSDLKMHFFLDLVKNYDHDFEFAMPESIKFNSQLYLEENDLVLMFVRACVVEDVGSCFTLKEAKNMFVACGHSLSRISKLKLDLQKTLGVRCLAQKRVASRGNANLCNVFMDFRLVDPNNEE